MILRRLEDERDLTNFNKTKELMFTCDSRILDYIEDLREKNNNKDVVLRFHLKIRLLKHGLRVGEYQFATMPKVTAMIKGEYGNALRNDNFNLLTPITRVDNRGHLFVESDYIMSKASYKITASDWTNDFKEKLGLGRFMIVEIPSVSIDLVVSPKAVLNDNEKLLKSRLETAYRAIKEMESEIKKGEWVHVVEKIRTLDLFKKDLTNYIKSIIDQVTGIGDEKAMNFTMAISQLHNYCSAFHHPDTAASYSVKKEDAYLAYMLTCSITNLIARKFAFVLNKKYLADQLI